MVNVDLKTSKVAILGIGIEGIALAGFLVDKVSSLTLLDRLPEEELLQNISPEEKRNLVDVLSKPAIKKQFGKDYLSYLKEFDLIYRSPGISFLAPQIQEAKKNGVVISSQIKLFFDLCPCKIIGVTGTKGKGTTASLISEILKKWYTVYCIPHTEKPQVFLAGNIGYPAITLIPKLKKYDIVILELSSFQLMDLEKSPHIAVITNLAVDHLDYHKDVDEYREAKLNILKYQTGEDYAVLNEESGYAPNILQNLKVSKKFFSSRNGGADATVQNNSVILEPEGRNIEICKLSQIKLFGEHNLQNIAAASLVSDILQVKPEVIQEVVRDFTGLPHRIELVKEIDGAKYINDSFATNPEPTIAAIKSFSEKKVLILGGSSKGADFNSLGKEITGSNVTMVILIGVEGPKIKIALEKSGFGGSIKEVSGNIADIVKTAKDAAEPGVVVLFSPACASFDMFKNYKDRGEKFKTAVLNLKDL